MKEKRVNDTIVDNDLRRENDVSGLPTLEDVQEFMMSLFKNWTEGPTGRTGQCSVSIDSRRKDFFPADSYLCSLSIGIYISEEFGLQKRMCFTWSMPDHSFPIPDKHLESAFYKKYPRETIHDQTLKEFSEMVHDLILIQNGLPFS